MNFQKAFIRPRFRRLHAQIALLGALLLAVAIGAHTWFTIKDQTTLGSMTLQQQAEALAKNIATASAAMIVTRRYSEIEELLTRTAEFPDVLRIQVSEPNGRVLSDLVSVDTGTPEPHFNTPPITPPKEISPRVEYADGYFVVWQPIDAGGLLGWVRMEYGLGVVVEIRDRISREGWVIGIVSIIISIALFLALLHRPMRALARATDFAGQLDQQRGQQTPVDTGSYELEQLGQALNRVSTRLQEQERAISASRTRLHAVLENAIDGIITTDGGGKIESVNPAAERLFGYRAEEIIGQNITALVPDLILGSNETGDGDPLPAAKPGELRIECAATGHRKDGSTFPTIIGLSEMTLEQRRMFVGIVRDVTERQRLDRMKNDFIASVSHELRTPLTSIHGSLGLMAAGEVEEIGAKAKNLVQLAYKNSERLVRLINDIVDFESIESGRMNFDLQVVDLLSIVNRSIEEMSDVAKQRRVKFVLEASANDGKVIVDVDRLLKVFTNLLANAARLSPANDRVTIRVLRHRNMLRVAITDHGPGVPDSFKKQIFEKFVQVDSADVRYKAGAGLGLSLAKAIVERFGGNISYDSVAYKETTFFVDLPEVDEP